jgi:hypothetical protein
VSKFWKTEDEFLRYVELHAESERALFHRDHVAHLHELAGQSCPPCLPEYVAMHEDYAEPLVAKARERLRDATN